MDPWVQLALIAPVMAYTGWPVHRTGWLTLRHRSADMNTLITLGTSAAFGYSLLVTLAADVLPADVREVYFEAVGVILTVTAGSPVLTDVVVLDGWSEAELLALVAGAERDSEHPLAAAVVEGATERGVEAGAQTAVESVTGRGVLATVDGHRLLVGNARLLTENDVDPAPLVAVAQDLSGQGKTAVLVAVDGRPAAVVAVADPVKPDSAAAVAEQRRLGLQAEGRRVAMVRDGVNDAPALAQADVGFAVASGTDVAIEAAGVTLMSGSLNGVVTAIRLSRATMRNIKQNLFFALAYNATGIPVAAGALYPALGVRLSPMIAAAAMAASSLSVVLNANRLRRWRPTT